MRSIGTCSKAKQSKNKKKVWCRDGVMRSKGQPVHEDVAGERLGAEGALLEEVVDLDDVRLVDVEHGRRLHGTAPLHVRRPAYVAVGTNEEGAPPREGEASCGTGIPGSLASLRGLPGGGRAAYKYCPAPRRGRAYS